jgi:formate hydrogenlyase subunit 4
MTAHTLPGPRAVPAPRGRGAGLVLALVPAVLLGMYFFLVQLLQIVLGYSAIETGLAFLPMAGLIFAGSQAVPRFLPRFGPRPFMIAGARAVLLSGVRLEDTGAAAGAMRAAQQLGAALGVAILVSVFAGVASGAARTQPQVFSAEVADAFVTATAFAVLTLVLVVFVLRPSRAGGADTA